MKDVFAKDVIKTKYLSYFPTHGMQFDDNDLKKQLFEELEDPVRRWFRSGGWNDLKRALLDENVLLELLKHGRNTDTYGCAVDRYENLRPELRMKLQSR